MTKLSIFVAAAMKHDLLPSFLFSLLPFAIVCALLVYLFHHSQTRYRKYLDRSLAHMDDLEKKTDRLIALLEKIEERK